MALETLTGMLDVKLPPEIEKLIVSYQGPREKRWEPALVNPQTSQKKHQAKRSRVVPFSSPADCDRKNQEMIW